MHIMMSKGTFLDINEVLSSNNDRYKRVLGDIEIRYGQGVYTEEASRTRRR
jgi:hypothetical protein